MTAPPRSSSEHDRHPEAKAEDDEDLIFLFLTPFSWVRHPESRRLHRLLGLLVLCLGVTVWAGYRLALWLAS